MARSYKFVCWSIHHRLFDNANSFARYKSFRPFRHGTIRFRQQTFREQFARLYFTVNGVFWQYMSAVYTKIWWLGTSTPIVILQNSPIWIWITFPECLCHLFPSKIECCRSFIVFWHDYYISPSSPSFYADMLRNQSQMIAKIYATFWNMFTCDWNAMFMHRGTLKNLI